MAGLGIAGLGLFGTNWLAKFGFLMPITSRLPTRITGLPGAEAGFSGNELAGALVWVIPVYIVLAVLLFVRARDVRAAWGWWRTVVLTAVIGMATLFVTGLLGLTQSRGGYLGFGLAMIGLAFIVLSRRWRLLLGSAVIAAVILLVAVWRFQDDTVLHVLVNDSPALSPDSALGTWEGRSEVWSRAIYGIQDFPFTGMGMNTFRRVVHVLYPLFLVSPDVDIAHAHNEFLQAGLDLGIPGLIAFVALYIGAFWMLADIWRLTPTSNLQPSTPALSKVEGSNLQLHLTRALVLGFGGGLFAHIVYSMTDAVALGAKPGFLFWMLLALIVGLFYQVRASPPIFRSK
jgi:putative inorganic carbon (HCO3(-)) transporter